MTSSEATELTSDIVDRPEYDDRAWPVFICTMPKRKLNHRAFVKHLDHLDGLYERGQPFALVVDVRDYPQLNATERKLIAERSVKMSAKYPGQLRGLVIVLSSSIARGIYTAINWMAPPPQPTAALSNISEALVWLKRHASLP